jgi:hypothetical protein
LKRKREFHPEQTTEQRKIQEKMWARQDAGTRTICNWFQFWRICREKPCRRAQSCSGDMHDCHARHWPLVPEDLKNWFRAALKALAAGHSPEEAARIAQGEEARAR